MKHALEIYQDHLDRISQHIWAKEFDTLPELMIFPHTVTTDDDVVTVDTPETAISWAQAFRNRLAELGATGYHRVAIAAAFSSNDEDRIDGFHRVYVLNGATHLVTPYPSQAKLQKHNGVWLASSVRATLRKARYVVDEDTLP